MHDGGDAVSGDRPDIPTSMSVPVTPEEALLCSDCLGQGQLWVPNKGRRTQCKRCGGGGYEPTRKPGADEGHQ